MLRNNQPTKTARKDIERTARCGGMERVYDEIKEIKGIQTVENVFRYSALGMLVLVIIYCFLV